MVAQDLIYIIGAVVGSNALTALITSHFAKKKSNAETQNIVEGFYSKMLETQNKELVKEQEKIEKLNQRVELLAKQHHECEQKGIAQAIELGILQKFIREERIEQAEYKIFILDDDKWVIHQFREKFSRVSITKVLTFESISEMREVMYQKPEILILDYRIHGETVDKLIGDLLAHSYGENYDPKIIIFSGLPKEYFDRLEYKGAISKFFSKDDDYVNEIVVFTMSWIEKEIKS